MDTKKVGPIGAGAWITWGAQVTAHRVRYVDEEDRVWYDVYPNFSVKGKGMVTEGVVPGGTYCCRLEEAVFVAGPGEGRGEEITDTYHLDAEGNLVHDGDPEDLAHDDAPQDLVVKPAHYARFPIEPITFIMKNNLPFWKGNPIKYLCRAGFKLYDGMDAKESELTDLNKAKRMIEMRINQLEGRDEL